MLRKLYSSHSHKSENQRKKKKGPGFKSQRVQSFLSEEKNAKNRENITVASGEIDSPLGKMNRKNEGLRLVQGIGASNKFG